ncbi:MAG: hypothetical protein K2Q01_00065, partial [Rickettsiales bacterium]|nr:hypothetical protein [Rickettsiales bacterium]
MTRNKRILLIIALAIAAYGANALLKKREASALAVVTPARAAAIRAVYATGTVEASVMLPIAPRTGARLIELLADEG